MRSQIVRDTEVRLARSVECPVCGARPDHLCMAIRGPRRGQQIAYHVQRVVAALPECIDCGLKLNLDETAQGFTTCKGCAEVRRDSR